MSNATGPAPKYPKPPRRRDPSYRLRIWRCGLCNVRCKTVLAPGGLCSVCRQQPTLFDVVGDPDVWGWSR